MSKRLRVLDPLSVSGRQRKETFNLGTLIGDILSGHKLQFDRHNVELQGDAVLTPSVRIRAVKGMIVQIIENLTSNSLYWLDLRREHEPGFRPRIMISLEPDPVTVTYRGQRTRNRQGVSSRKVFRCILLPEGEIQAQRSRALYRPRMRRIPWRSSLTLNEDGPRATRGASIDSFSSCLMRS